MILTLGLSPAIQKTISFSRLIPGEVNRAREYLLDASGKSINVSRVLRQAGEEVTALVPVGTENSNLFRNLCRRDGLVLAEVPTRGRVRKCYTLLDLETGEATELVVNEPEPVLPAEEEALKEQYLTLLNEGIQAVALSGSRLPGFSEDLIPFLVREARKRNLLFFADYRGEDLRNSFQSEDIKPDYVKINAGEFDQTFPEYTHSNLGDRIARASEEFRCAFIITRGADSTLYAEGGVKGEMESLPVKAVNPIGCGDAFTAGLIHGITRQNTLRESVEWGREFASRNALSRRPGWIKETENHD